MSTKEVQGKLWSTAPHLWAGYFEPYFTPLYKKALTELQLDENSLLLDAGCGSGLFSFMAIREGADVIGVDASYGLLEIARQRNPENSFLEEDLETLPFAKESFDVVTGFNSFQFAGDFKQGLTEAKRVLKKGGKLLIGIWDREELSEASVILKAIGSLLPPPPPGTPGPFALSEDGRIEGICRSIGLQVVKRIQVEGSFLFRSLNDAVKCFIGTGPAAAAGNHVSKAEVEKKVVEALQPYQLTEDLYHLQNSFLLFIAEK